MLLLLAIPAWFVGNQACAPCHSEIAKSYNQTPMAISSGRNVGPVTPGRFRQASSGVQYDIDREGLVTFSKGAARGERRLDYYIGSGAAGRSYLYARDGFLFEAPVSWYTQAGKWDMSPGYEGDRASHWSRAVEPSCLGCHASQIRGREGTQNGYADPPFAQNGIACERCHGPGSLHIEGKGKMMNPAKLDASRRDSVCAQCHLSGESSVQRSGRKLADFRAGDNLSDFAAYFVTEGSSDLQVNSHVEKLSKSVCKRKAGDRLWCGTCHDPHQVPAAAERAGWFRARCLTCHEPATCERGPDCVACHMPKGRAVDAHGVFTDHSIPRVPAKPQVKASPSWQLRGVSAADTGDRELGLAYAELGVRSGNKRQQAEAIRLLSAAPRDVEVQVRLADLQQRAGSAETAGELYRSALRQDPNSVVALVNLGRLYGTNGFLDQAITLWREALKRNPCQAEAGENLQIALRAKKDAAGADAVRTAQSFCVFE